MQAIPMTILPFRVSAPLTFHVLFIPGTIEDLRVFAASFAVCGAGCRIRLVSNGCSRAEENRLRQLERLSTQFEFFRLPTRKTWAHGRALTYLQRQETGSRFAFLDSDIFATGDFVADLQIHSVDALFSCPPVYSTDQTLTVPRGFQLASGLSFLASDGLCLGGSYFAVYDNRTLTDCMQRYGIDLRPYLWGEIPSAIRARCARAGYQMAYYDTTKLVNLLLNLDGFQCQFRTTRQLHHVGGISATAPPTDWLNWMRRRLAASMPRFVRQIADWSGLCHDWRNNVSADELRCRSREAARRRSVCTHIYELVRRLNRGEAPGACYSSGDADVDANVQNLERVLCNQFPRWRAWLDSREHLMSDAAHRPDPTITRAA